VTVCPRVLRSENSGAGEPRFGMGVAASADCGWIAAETVVAVANVSAAVPR